MKKRNAAAQHSIDNGSLQKVGSREYMGDAPVFADMRTDPMSPPNWVKVKKGIPFVRV